MSGAGELYALAERCEAATAADFNLDCDIARAMGYHVPYPPTGGSGSVIPSPIWRYSQSLDAAMTLVPDGCEWKLDTHHNLAGVFDYPTDPESGPYCVEYTGEAPTPALALCAAALRARASQEAAK